MQKIESIRGVVIDHNNSLTLATLENRALLEEEVLVNIYAAPINPSDVNFCSNSAPYAKQIPNFAGFEGSGLVVSAGSGTRAQSLLGKKVALFGMPLARAYGTWAEYSIIDSANVYPVEDSIGLEKAASAIVNPMTAQALILDVLDAGHKAVVLGASSSSLGKMLVALCRKYELRSVCLVRRKEYVQSLRDLGADYVLDTSDPNFKTEVAQVLKDAAVTAYLDPVTGPEGAFISGLLPANSLTIIYGRLSKEEYTLDPRDILSREKTVVGFILGLHLAHPTKGPRILSEGFSNIKHGFLSATVVQRFELKDFQAAISHVKSNPASDGKVLLFNENFSGNI